MENGKGRGAGQHRDGSSSRWCLIESDPGVFTELVEKVGVKDIEFEEVLGVDEESFQQLRNRNQKLYGFIFLFNWTKDSARSNQETSRENNTREADVLMQDDSNGIVECPPDLFFAKQVSQKIFSEYISFQSVHRGLAAYACEGTGYGYVYLHAYVWMHASPRVLATRPVLPCIDTQPAVLSFAMCRLYGRLCTLLLVAPLQ